MYAMRATTLAVLSALALAAVPGCKGSSSDDGTVTVTGRVVDLGREPLANVVVHVLGHPPVATAADGRFAVSGVRPPYDVVALGTDGGATRVVVYEGLTTAAPVVGLGVEGAQRSAPFGASVAPYTPVGGAQAVGAVVSPSPSGHGTSIAADGTFSSAFDFHWSGPAATTASMVGLQLTTGTDGLPTAYLGCWSLEGIALTDGVASSGHTLASRTVGSRATTLTVGSLPTGLSLVRAAPSLRLSEAAAISLPFVSAPGTDIPYLAPTVDGATFQVAVHARNADFDEVVKVVDLAPGQDTATVAMPAGIAVAAPAAGAELTTATEFAWTSDPGGVYELRVAELNASGIEVLVVTSRERVTLAALGAVGVPLPAGADLFWNVSLLPAATVDQAASAAAMASYERIAAGHLPTPSGVTYARTNTRHNPTP